MSLPPAPALARHGPSPAGSTGLAYACVTTLFFAWGLITSLLDPLVAATKAVFVLSALQAQLGASAFFLAYGVISLPAAALLSRRGAAATLLIALALMAAGCGVMLLAANLARYPLMLAGLFTVASGITLLQVVANPLAVSLGPPDRAHLRLTFAQALNSLGTFVGPYVGAVLFLRGLDLGGSGDAARGAALAGIDRAFLWVGALVAALGLFVAWRRRLFARGDALAAEPLPLREAIGRPFRSRWAVLGGAAIFLYVGAEVAIGTHLALLLHEDAVMGASLEQAGKFVSLYWGGALIGRLLGSALLARVPATRLLLACALAAGTGRRPWRWWAARRRAGSRSPSGSPTRSCSP